MYYIAFNCYMRIMFRYFLLNGDKKKMEG
jgi:hypothetical protein